MLGMLDLSVLVIAGTVTGDLAKQAARAAANSPDQGSASIAVQNCQKQFPKVPIYDSPTLTLKYAGGFNGTATVTATVNVIIPVAVPMLGVPTQVPITTQASEPVVAVPPP